MITSRFVYSAINQGVNHVGANQNDERQSGNINPPLLNRTIDATNQHDAYERFPNFTQANFAANLTTSINLQTTTTARKSEITTTPSTTTIMPFTTTSSTHSPLSKSSGVILGRKNSSGENFFKLIINGPEIIDNKIVTGYDIYHNLIKKHFPLNQEVKTKSDLENKFPSVLNLSSENFTKPDHGDIFNFENLVKQNDLVNNQSKNDLPEIEITGEKGHISYKSQWSLDQTFSSGSNTMSNSQEKFSFAHLPGQYSKYNKEASYSTKSKNNINVNSALPSSFLNELNKLVNSTTDDLFQRA